MGVIIYVWPIHSVLLWRDGGHQSETLAISVPDQSFLAALIFNDSV